MIKDEGFSFLVSTKFAKFESAFLGQNQLTCRGFFSIQSCSSNRLLHLSISNNNVSTKGVKSLIKVNFPNIITVQMNNCCLSETGFSHLAKGRWPSLQFLFCFGYSRQSSRTFLKDNIWRNLKHFVCGATTENPIQVFHIFTCPWEKMQKLEVFITNLELEKEIRELQSHRFIKLGII